MSDIKRYGVWDKPPREDLVTYADHEAAIALRTRVCAEAFEDELARTEERVLADAKARIEGERIESDGMDSWENGYHTGIDAALAALTQPQTERCPEDCDGFGQLIGDSDGPCPACSGLEPDRGGAATVTVELTRDEAKVLLMADHHVECDEKLEALQDSASDKIEAALADTEPGPYAKAFRERVCPVPEFPGIKKEES